MRNKRVKHPREAATLDASWTIRFTAGPAPSAAVLKELRRAGLVFENREARALAKRSNDVLARLAKEPSLAVAFAAAPRETLSALDAGRAVTIPTLTHAFRVAVTAPGETPEPADARPMAGTRKGRFASKARTYLNDEIAAIRVSFQRASAQDTSNELHNATAGPKREKFQLSNEAVKSVRQDIPTPSDKPGIEKRSPSTRRGRQ